MKVNINPLSVNKCWAGRKFKTPDYKRYEKELLLILPDLEVPKGKLSLVIKVGFSSKLADLDNIAKPFIDILQKHFNFNDRNIFKITLEKEIVNKNFEYIDFEITSYIDILQNS